LASAPAPAPASDTGVMCVILCVCVLDLTPGLVLTLGLVVGEKRGDVVDGDLCGDGDPRPIRRRALSAMVYMV
jgi:hypothetical protein